MKTISKSEKSDVTAKKLGKTRGKNCFFIKKFESALKNIILLLILGRKIYFKIDINIDISKAYH